MKLTFTVWRVSLLSLLTNSGGFSMMRFILAFGLAGVTRGGESAILIHGYYPIDRRYCDVSENVLLTCLSLCSSSISGSQSAMFSWRTAANSSLLAAAEMPVGCDIQASADAVEHACDWSCTAKSVFCPCDPGCFRAPHEAFVFQCSPQTQPGSRHAAAWETCRRDYGVYPPGTAESLILVCHWISLVPSNIISFCSKRKWCQSHSRCVFQSPVTQLSAWLHH